MLKTLVCYSYRRRWTDEKIWHACFGEDTPQSILQHCARVGVAPRDFASTCVHAALGEMRSNQFDYTEAMYSLCDQLGVEST